MVEKKIIYMNYYIYYNLTINFSGSEQMFSTSLYENPLYVLNWKDNYCAIYKRWLQWFITVKTNYNSRSMASSAIKQNSAKKSAIKQNNY